MRTIEVFYNSIMVYAGKIGHYTARFRDRPGWSAPGTTPAQAVGDLVRDHPEMFNEVSGEHVALDRHRAPTSPFPLAYETRPATDLGRLVLQFPDVYGVAIALIDPQMFPQSSKKAELCVA